MSLAVLNLLNSNHRRGAEAFGVDLGNALTERGLDVRTVALSSAATGPVHEVETLGPPGLSAARRTVRAHQLARQADVIIGHGGQTLFAGTALRYSARRPFIYRVIGEPSAWAHGGSRRRRVGFALRRAEAVAVYYESVASDLSRRFGVERHTVHVITKGIDPAPFGPATDQQRADARKALGLSNSEPGPVVLYLGALGARKNIGQVVRATSQVPGAQLLIVGDGPARSGLEALAQSRGVAATFQQATDDIATCLAAADVVALTSDTEGVPTVLLEAGLSGLGVVATPVGGVPTVVVDGQTGRLVSRDDVAATASAIIEVARRRDEFGGHARDRILAAHDLDAVARRWEGLCSAVVGDG